MSTYSSKNNQCRSYATLFSPLFLFNFNSTAGFFHFYFICACENFNSFRWSPEKQCHLFLGGFLGDTENVGGRFLFALLPSATPCTNIMHECNRSDGSLAKPTLVCQTPNINFNLKYTKINITPSPGRCVVSFLVRM